jgi:hypothetical protein
VLLYYGNLLEVFEERFPVPMTGELRETYDRLRELMIVDT